MIQKSYSEVRDLLKKISNENKITEQVIYNAIKSIDPEFSTEDVLDNSSTVYTIERSKIFKDFMQKVFQDATPDEIIQFYDPIIALGSDELKKLLAVLPDESSRTQYIVALHDNGMKLSFLEDIKERKNREDIIQSLTCYIDPELQKIVKLAQNMIWEWIEDVYYPDKIPEEKREIVQIEFNRTGVKYEELDFGINGEADTKNHKIRISQRRRFHPGKIIGYLEHEYSHIFVNRNFALDSIMEDETLEEGNADVFGELVINHYMQRHPEIKEEFLLHEPYISNSAYDFENGWARSLLYPLEADHLDGKALLEYLVGDKKKYKEMTLGKEYGDSAPIPMGLGSIPITYKKLYETHEEAFQDINQDSIYYRRNYILPAFVIQTKMGEQIDLKVYELGDQRLSANYRRDFYFSGRSLGEIDPEEMQEFITLINKAKCIEYSFFNPIEEFAQSQYERLTEEEKRKKCSIILENTIILLNNEIDMSEMESTILEVIDYQIEKIELGKDKEQTRHLQETLQSTTLNFSKLPQDIKENLEDAFSYLITQLKSAEPKQGNQQEVMQFIRKMAEDPEVGVTREEMQMGINTMKQEVRNEHM